MTEKDCYGLFGAFDTARPVAVGTAFGGLLFTILGLLGYDTGNRAGIIGVPEETRWMGHILWHEVAIGLSFIALADFQFWLTSERKK